MRDPRGAAPSIVSAQGAESFAIAELKAGEVPDWFFRPRSSDGRLQTDDRYKGDS
ncbi:MAG TPA: hypothetical protein VGA31_05075 [Thermoanaerobaculia bacterium]